MASPPAATARSYSQPAIQNYSAGASQSVSGDCYFDYVYLAEFPNALIELRKHASPRDMIALYGNQQKRISNEAVNITAMSACYSPNPDSPWGFDYPFDLETGELREDVWARWLVHDPVRMASRRPCHRQFEETRGTVH